MLTCLPAQSSPGVDFNQAPVLGLSNNPHDIVTGDFNHDGKVDLAVAAGLFPGSGGVIILLGRGKFRQAATENLPGSSVAVADFNGDSKLDLVTAHSHTNFVTVLLGNGDGTFRAIGRLGIEPAPPLYQPANTVLATTGDFNGDAKIDIVIAHSDPSLSFWLGNGDGTFVIGTQMRTLGSYPSDIELADLDGNGKLDVAAGGAMVLLATAGGTFSTHYYSAGQSVGGLAIADLNADGRPDILAAALLGGGLTLLFNKGMGMFAASERYSLGSTQRPVGLGEIAMLDLNNDGKLDVIGPALDAYSISFIVRLGVGDGTFAGPTVYPLASLTQRFALEDLDGDRQPDVVTLQSGSLAVLLGQPDGTFASAQTRSLVVPPARFGLGDFNADGKVDIIILNAVTNATMMFGAGDGGFGPERQIDTIVGGGFLAIDDFNNDDKLDLVKQLDVFLGRGDGTFFQSSTNSFRDQTDLKTADLDADGNPDVVAVSSHGKVAVYLGDGDGNLGLLNTYSPDWTTGAAAIGDFNNDTRLDIAVTGDGHIHILLGLGDGTFTLGGRFVAGGGRIAAGDLNQDGMLDLVLVLVGRDQDHADQDDGSLPKEPKAKSCRQNCRHCITAAANGRTAEPCSSHS